MGNQVLTPAPPPSSESAGHFYYRQTTRECLRRRSENLCLASPFALLPSWLEMLTFLHFYLSPVHKGPLSQGANSKERGSLAWSEGLRE